MRLRFGSYLMLPLVLLSLLLMVACAGASSAPTASSPQAALTAAPAAATPLPPSARTAMEQFVQQQQELEADWDKYHQEFDQWRAGLTSCHRSSVQAALRDFSVGFNSVTEQARDLPRTATTREMADILIEAAGAEETAFRQLRDRWQPNNVSLFEVVEERRSEAAMAQKQAEDQAIDLQEELEEGADPEEVAAVEEFSEAYDDLKEGWKQFHDDYSDLRKEADGLDTPTVIASLEALIEQFGPIVGAIDELPESDATENMIEVLQEAADAQLMALKALKDGLETGGPPPLPVAGEEKGGLGAMVYPPPTPSPGAEVIITAPLLPEMGPDSQPAASFDDVDTAVEKSKEALKEVSRSIKTIVDDSPAESLAEVKDFNSDYRKLLEEWDAFHQGYDDWRKTEGGCDRTAVLEALDKFNLRVNNLGRQVRDLPQASYLLPMYTLLVEAAEREEGAIRALRNSWRPFNVDVFKAVDQERFNANRLRRQADIGLQELGERF